MITILTDPLPIKGHFISEWARRFCRPVRDIYWAPTYNYGRYRGHYAVTRSLIEGLEKNNLSHNYNPTSLAKLAEVVVVLAGVHTLNQAIELKRTGHIHKLYAGPNVVEFASDFDFLLGSPEIDAIITPSKQVRDLYVEDCASLACKCIVWPAGVNVEYWKPSPNTEKRGVLLYDKRNGSSNVAVSPYIEHLQKEGFSVEIIRYGSFQSADYLRSLQRAQLMVGFTVGSESQGIAWAEAWAVDVPTLIWRNERNVYRGRSYSCSTAPYLNAVNGLFFDDFQDFTRQFTYWKENSSQFSARNWTVSNLSDEVCSARLYKSIMLH